MTSKEGILGENLAEMQENASFSSEGETYDDDSYGSDIQPPDLAKGFVMVKENHCRARYRKSRSAADAPYLICLNKSDCRSLAGGRHPVLRGCQRAEPGVYEGVYSSIGKLTAARSGTRSSIQSLAKSDSDTRASNRAQAASIGELSSDMAQKEPGFSSETRASTRPQVTDPDALTRDVSPFTIPEAERLLTPELDQIVEDRNVGSNLGNNQNAMLLTLMSSLCDKIEKLDSGIAEGNTSIIRELSKARAPSILHRASFASNTATGDGSPVSSVARRHAQAAEDTEMLPEHLRDGYNPFDEEEEIVEVGNEGDLAWDDHVEDGDIDTRSPPIPGSRMHVTQNPPPVTAVCHCSWSRGTTHDRTVQGGMGSDRVFGRWLLEGAFQEGEE